MMMRRKWSDRILGKLIARWLRYAFWMVLVLMLLGFLLELAQIHARAGTV
jgi:hypothetical protein